MRDLLRALLAPHPADEARDRRFWIAGYRAALKDVEKSQLRPFREPAISQAAESAWDERTP